MASTRHHKNDASEPKPEFKEELKRVRDELGIGEAMADPLGAAGVSVDDKKTEATKDGI